MRARRAALDAALTSYRPEDTGFGHDDARFLHRHGFNTIRLGIIYKGLEPQPPGADGKPDYRRGYLRSIARTERVLAQRKIFTLLDFHQDLYNERFEGRGMARLADARRWPAGRAQSRVPGQLPGDARARGRRSRAASIRPAARRSTPGR